MKKRKAVRSFPDDIKNRAAETERAELVGTIPPSDTDPDGSYTGKPREENSVPVQDADDL